MGFCVMSQFCDLVLSDRHLAEVRSTGSFARFVCSRLMTEWFDAFPLALGVMI